MKIPIIILLMMFIAVVIPQNKYEHCDKNLICSLSSSKENYLSDFLAIPEKFEVQIIYTKINRDNIFPI